MNGYIQVKNFEKFQHYKERNPIWIKLYYETLDDYEFACLPDASKWLAVGLWMLASRTENRIPNDLVWIAKKLSLTEKVRLDDLLSAGFITIVDNSDSASKPLSSGYQNARLEKEKEKEKEKETEHIHAAQAVFLIAKSEFPKRPGVSWKDAEDAFMKRVLDRKQPVSPKAMLDGVKAYAEFCRAENVEPRYIKHPATFFGPKRYWEADWTPTTQRNPDIDVSDVKMLMKAAGRLVFNAFQREDGFRKMEQECPAAWRRLEGVMKKIRYSDLKDAAEKQNGIEFNELLRAQLREIAA